MPCTLLCRRDACTSNSCLQCKTPKLHIHARQASSPICFSRKPQDAGAYSAALVAAWRGSGEHPFLLDNVWDLVHLLDYLEQRPDVDAARIGMTGISLGGMHTWLCASLDTRVAVAAPMIGVQSFKWAVDNECFQVSL